MDRDKLMLFVMFGVAAGVSCAFLRYPFLPLPPIGVLLAVGAVLTGLASGTHPGVIAAEVFGSIAAPQFAFVAVSLTDHLVRSSRLIPQVQAAIGRQLAPNSKRRAACHPNWLLLLPNWFTRSGDESRGIVSAAAGNASRSRSLGALAGANHSHD